MNCFETSYQSSLTTSKATTWFHLSATRLTATHLGQSHMKASSHLKPKNYSDSIYYPGLRLLPPELKLNFIFKSNSCRNIKCVQGTLRHAHVLKFRFLWHIWLIQEVLSWDQGSKLRPVHWSKWVSVSWDLRSIGTITMYMSNDS